jgi:DNA-binding NarL/FixJ family response regulator
MRSWYRDSAIRQTMPKLKPVKSSPLLSVAKQFYEEGDVIVQVDKFPRPLALILVVEDFSPYRSFITAMLKEKNNLRVICEAGDGIEAVERALQLKADLILMDIGLPRLNGIEAARRILKELPDSRIIFLTQETSPEIIQEALSFGARGYVIKTRAAGELMDAIEAVLQGKVFVSQNLDGHKFGGTIKSSPED